MTSSPVTPSAVDDAPDWPAAFVRRYLDAGHWQDQNFAEALAASAARHPRRSRSATTTSGSAMPTCSSAAAAWQPDCARPASHMATR